MTGIILKAFIFLAAIAVLSIIALLVVVALRFTKRNFSIYRQKIKHFASNLKYRFILLKSLNTILKHQYANHSVEIVFAMFEHYYKHHLDETELLASHADMFPEGRFSLTKMHKYITKTRIDNMKESECVHSYNGQFDYWGETYTDFAYKMKDNELLICPTDNIADATSVRKKLLRIDNELYMLDNEMAQWIIDRRKYLMI